jgi:hypothetical protein
MQQAHEKQKERNVRFHAFPPNRPDVVAEVRLRKSSVPLAPCSAAALLLCRIIRKSREGFVSETRMRQEAEAVT